MSKTWYDKATEAVSFLQARGFNNPEYGIIFGSGLGDISEFEIIHKIPYAEIPHFPLSTVEGHEGYLLYGKVGEKNFIAQQGRFHYYEGYSGMEIIFGVRVMKLLGAHSLLVSNAAGGVSEELQVGDLMMITDHINMLPNPLIGANDERFGVRFPDMTHTYDQDMRKQAIFIAAMNDIKLKEGIYFANTGPSFETPAEYNYMRTIGADAVGMSTTSEVIAARHLGMRVFGIAVVTNQAYNFTDSFVNDGKDVIAVANKAATKVGKIFAKLIK